MKVDHSTIQSDSYRRLYSRSERGGVMLKLLGSVAALAVIVIAAIIVFVPKSASGPSAATEKTQNAVIYPAYFYSGGQLLPDSFLDSEFTVQGKKIAEEKIPVRRFLEIFFNVQLDNGKTREFKSWRVTDNEYALRFGGKENIDRVNFTHVLSPPSNGKITWFFIKDVSQMEAIQYVMLNIQAHSEAFPDARWFSTPLPIESMMTQRLTSVPFPPALALDTAPAATPVPTAQNTPSSNPTAAQADEDGEVGQTVKTRYGTLTNDTVNDAATMNFDGRKLNFDLASIKPAFRMKYSVGSDDVILGNYASGASCVMHFFVIVTPGGEPRMSRSFGTCDDFPKVTRTADAVEVRMSNREGALVTYRLQRGSLTENGQPVR